MKDLIIETLYKIIKVPYEYFFKTKAKAWNLTIEDYMKNDTNSLGYQLGSFLLNHNYSIQEKLEEHDVYHVLTNTGITVLNEIEMQFYLLGNGKRSPFVFIVISTGIVFYPYEYKKFYTAFKKGKQAHQFYHLDFSKVLHMPLTEVQYIFNIKN
ncbi:Coq4 family protein [Flavobacterium urocaniciphilum]|uniref:Coenzyme Q (Ubiquinone) biosynthesis protein Coq4 n=1 Tax=Flavobacterium urocaniciphilum TaxID=1299341 RepID=A0A1H8ZP32_9FLAO|nr:Coq4 family protein [Flavobacterium urocaniciphilum]SEP66031.1 Coenzyme Q (ubiquinone) biosynthesis protein Coq4 [Flavobacterium urocaniciphilum]